MNDKIENNEIDTVIIVLGFIEGPILYSDFETGEPLTGIDIVDDDPILKELNRKCSHIYSDYYEFNSHGMACWFNNEQEKADKEILLDLITRIIDRLNEINDGSFVIDDRETERLKSL